MKEITKIYFSSFFQGFASIASVTFTLFFLANTISQAQIGILFAIFMIAMAIFEIPTGGFADTFGHKKSVFLGIAIHSLSSLIFFVGTTFFHFLIAMLLAALGLAFVSGAMSSLVYDLLQREKKTDLYEKVQGKIFGYFLLAAFIAGPIGAYIFQFNVRISMLLAFIASAISAYCIYLVSWEFKGKKPTTRIYVNKILIGMKLAIRNQRLMGLVLIGIALTTARIVFNQNISQPYQLDIGISIFSIGIVASIVSVVSAFISLHTHSVLKKISTTTALIGVVALPAVCLFLLSNIYASYGVLFILLFYMAHAFREPVMVSLGQKEVADEQRSTMVSTMSFIISIVVGLFLPLWGANIDVHGVRIVLIFLGVFTIAFGIFGIYLYKTAR